MKVHFPPWIKCMRGYFDGLVFYRYPELPNISYARAYVKPRITAHNHYYGACFKAIINFWKAAAPDFKQDLRDYTKAWNQTQWSQELEKPHYNAVNILIKTCFSIAREKGFDLRTLTLENFSGTPTALLGNQEPTVANFIKAAEGSTRERVSE